MGSVGVTDGGGVDGSPGRGGGTARETTHVLHSSGRARMCLLFLRRSHAWAPRPAYPVADYMVLLLLLRLWCWYYCSMLIHPPSEPTAEIQARVPQVDSLANITSLYIFISPTPTIRTSC